MKKLFAAIAFAVLVAFVVAAVSSLVAIGRGEVFPAPTHPTIASGERTAAKPLVGPPAPKPPPPTPATARAVAVAYATAAFSTDAGQPSDAWVKVVAPISTATWRAHLLAANGAVANANTTTRPRLVSTYPSYAPVGSVGVTVVLREHGATESLYVVLRKETSHYLVEATQ